MDALDLIAKIKMDLSEYEEGLDKASSKAEKSGSSISKAFGSVASGVGKAMATVTKVTAAAVTAAATGVAALTKAAVENYAEYEQLEGGISKLFGTAGQSLEDYASTFNGTMEEAQESYKKLENAEETVMNNASKAWKTAGISANEYMNTVTNLSGAIISSLDYDMEKAAEYADRAITDMSDIANTYGMTMEDVSSVYSSVSRGIYNTLDNITKGAFAGTKTGYQELIDTMASYTDIQEELNVTVEKGNYDYANFVNAMSVYTAKTNIAGTTAREASTTISGSLNQMKAAWTNLVTGIADENANLDDLMKNLVDSIVGYTDETGKEVNGFLDNIIPVIETALTSIGTLIENLVPDALNLIPTLITDVLPSITEAAAGLVEGLVTSLSENMDTIGEVVSQLLTALVDLLPDVVTLAGQLVSTLGSAITDNLDIILDAAGEILEIILKGISENADKLVDGAIKIIESLGKFFAENVEEIQSAAAQIYIALATGISEHMGELIELGLTIITAMTEGLLENIDVIINALPDLIDGLISGLLDHLDEITEAWVTLMSCIGDAVPQIIESLSEVMPEIIQSMVDYWTGDGAAETLKAGLIMFNALNSALAQIVVSIFKSQITFITNLVAKFTGSSGEMEGAGESMFNGLLSGIMEVVANIVTSIKIAVSEWVQSVKDTVSDWKTAGSALLSGLWEGFKSKLASVKDNIVNGAKTITDGVKNVFSINSPSKVFAGIGASLVEGLEDGWDDNIDEANNKIDSDLNGYKGSVEMDYKLNTVQTATNKTKTLSESDVSKLLSNLSINLTNNTNVDGKNIKSESYKYTVNRIGNETRALKVATGGAY